MRLDASAPVPLYQQVAADIRRRIVSGNMPVGIQIPPHKELAVQYGVSVITINKALSGLVSEGLLHSHVGRGTFVMVRPASTSGIAAPTTIGFVLRDLSSPFFSLVAHAAQQRADDLGVGILFASSSNRLDREEEQIRRLRLLGVHGLIIVSMSRTFRISEAIQALHDEDFPYTMVSWTAGDDVPFVGLDLAEAGFLAAEHLLSLGHTRFGYLIDRVGSLNGELRMSRYRSAIEEAGFEINPAFIFEHSFAYEESDYKSGYAAGQTIAGLRTRPQAMFCFNDLGALGLEDGLLDAGIKVPGDIAIVGLDDIELAKRARVPLTTVRQPVDEIGARSVDSILARLRGERHPVRQLLPAELIVRSSSGTRVRPAARKARR
ncbi:MAG: regulatory protein GntR [Gemmatimonadetes bacterium]|nr:regulatory protein GntR [Gemmatimonadota bacterium]